MRSLELFDGRAMLGMKRIVFQRSCFWVKECCFKSFVSGNPLLTANRGISGAKIEIYVERVDLKSPYELTQGSRPLLVAFAIHALLYDEGSIGYQEVRWLRLILMALVQLWCSGEQVALTLSGKAARRATPFHGAGSLTGFEFPVSPLQRIHPIISHVIPDFQ